MVKTLSREYGRMLSIVHRITALHVPGSSSILAVVFARCSI